MTMMTNMVKQEGWKVVGVAEAKAKLSELLELVGRGQRIVVAKRGKPVAVLAPPEAVSAGNEQPRGLATLAGALADWVDLERDMDAVIGTRSSARERRVPDLQ